MFDDPKLSIRAVRRVLNLTEEFLDNKKLVRDVAQELKIVIPQYEAMPIRAVMDHNDPPALGKHLEHAVYYWSATLGFKPIPPAKYHHMLKVIFPQDDVSAHDPDNFVAKAPPKGFQPLDDPDAGIMYPMYYPWMRGAGPAYGCKDYELVRAFERMAPIGGWQTYPTPHEQSGIVGYAQELANQRKRDQHDQAQRMRRPIFKTVNLHPGE
jgi:hypothetical protein